MTTQLKCVKCGKEARFMLSSMCSDWDILSSLGDSICPDCRKLESANAQNDATKPDYYGKLDVLKFCLENNIPFCEGNIIKYVVRYTKKNGLEDLKKAREYLDRLIKRAEEK